MLIHKRVITETTVRPKNRRSYKRTNYNQVECYKPWKFLKEDGDLATVVDEDVTCPECLRRM